MRALILILAILGATSASAQSALDQLAGSWTVDLRPTPTAEAYTQPFVVKPSESAPFAGTFYGSELSNVVVNDDWGALRIAFTTSDGSGVYQHVAVLDGTRLAGTTHSIGRGFLAVWTATRDDE